ncbi:hypothetical protein STAS_14549 [Striga asiatica]|uniref:Polyadenylate-binding protein 1-B-binding protein n=1 Tax=Striga asiatica TaxID=4170 RepID=A0A5A7PZM7_STRAF|nr:hypothetical protein STAS_14549 [Striga asiatica]
MDREQEEIQFLGLFGILKESCDLVLSSPWRKIFAQITLLLILPLSSVYLSHIEITEILFRKIMHNEFMLEWTPEGTRIHQRLAHVLRSELTAFFLFKIAYILFFILLALLSTAAIVYTIACIYTAKEITLTRVASVVPKVWKRLALTFLCSFALVFAYNVLSLLLLVLGAVTVGPVRVLGVVCLVLFSVVYLVGLLYITIIWHLASVVSVLEQSYGFGAMRKSKGLIRGKMGISAAVFLVLALLFLGVEHMFKIFVVFGEGKGLGERIGYGMLCVILLSITMLFGLVAQTIVYFVCKSYHHENIDKSSLADHLGAYLGEYVPLKSKDLQLQQFEV